MNRALRLLALAALAAFAAACASNKTTVEKPAELHELKPTVKFVNAWSRMVAGEDEDGLMLGLAPASDGERVYAAGRDGRVQAFDLASGRRLWRRELPRLTLGSPDALGWWNRFWFKIGSGGGQRLAGGPGVGAGLVVVGSSDGEVAALAADDGRILWNVTVGGEVNVAPVTDGRVVIVRLANGQIVALDAATGVQRWYADQPAPSLSLRGSGRPLLDGDRVYAGFDNGKVAAYDAQRGALLWESPLATPSGRSEIERLVDVDGVMRLAAGELYAVAYHGRAASLDAESGRPLWQRDLSSSAGLSADGGAVFVTDSDSQVWSLDRVNGGPLWTQSDLRARMLTAPAAAGAYVVVGDLDGLVHVLDRESGAVVGRRSIDGSPLVAPPLVVGDLVLVQSAGGRLVAFRIVPKDAKGG